MSKDGVFSGPYFLVIGLNAEKYLFSLRSLSDILLVFIYFIRTYYSIYFYHVLFFSSADNSLYLFFALSLSLSLSLNLSFHFYNILWLYLVLFLCFFDNKLFHSFFIYNKENHNDPLFSFKFEFFVILIALIFANIPKMNSIIASFNRNNSNITNHSKDMAHI